MHHSNLNHLFDQDREYISSNDLFDRCINSTQTYSLFLDIDGTISEFHIDPQQSFISPHVLNAIGQIIEAHTQVIAITGRRITDAIRLFQSVKLPIAGTHGLEMQFDSDRPIEQIYTCFDFERIANELSHKCSHYPQFRIEAKKYAVVLHFRSAPHLEHIALNLMQQLQQQYPQLKLTQGKYVFELILAEANKGVAIAKMYQTLKLTNSIPIFIGDDQTDEDGFIEINHLNGISIKVGKGKTHAQYRLMDINNAIHFIHLFKNFITRRN